MFWNSKKRICMLAVFAGFLCLPTGMQEVHADEGIVIGKDAFPDSYFRSTVSEYDTNKDGRLSQEEREAVTTISLYLVKDAQGIEYFPNLERVTASGYVEKVDLSHNTKLTSIQFSACHIGKLDCSNLTELQSLYLKECKVTEVNLKNTEKLETIEITNAGLRTLDVSDCAQLQILKVTSNELTSLDVSHNKHLKYLYVSKNPIAELDLKKNTELCSLTCSETPLTEVDLSACSETSNKVECIYGSLRRIKLRKGAKAELNIFACRIAALNLQGSVSTSTDGIALRCCPGSMKTGTNRKIYFSNLLDFDPAQVEAILGGTLQDDCIVWDGVSEEITYTYRTGVATKQFKIIPVLDAAQENIPDNAFVSGYGQDYEEYRTTDPDDTADRVVENPSREKDQNGAQKVTWDCVWFGTYPQAEVISTEMEQSAWYRTYCGEKDLVVSDVLYEKLNNATEWDTNGDTVIDGVRYRRMVKSDRVYSVESTSVYRWGDDTTYHYFQYQPVKWRVLEVNGNRALLLSDVVLDIKKYHEVYHSGGTTWERATIRSWLNGYDGAANDCGTDYRGDNFIDHVFSSKEQAAILSTKLKNDKSLFHDTAGCGDTTDKLFFLSESDVYYTNKAQSYGFAFRDDTNDPARIASRSMYVRANGGMLQWKLRSPGMSKEYITYVNKYGAISTGGDYTSNIESGGVRPALTLDLSNTDTYTYAGIVCSDGTESEERRSTDDGTGGSGTGRNESESGGSGTEAGGSGSESGGSGTEAGGSESGGSGTEAGGSGSESGGSETETGGSESGGSGTETGGSGSENGGSGTETGGSGSESGGSGTETGGNGSESGGSGTETGGNGSETNGSENETGGNETDTNNGEDTEQGSTQDEDHTSSEASSALHNPVVEEDSSLQAGQKVLWDTIQFGSYPQSEVTSEQEIYTTLASATDWDAEGNLTWDGVRYHRIAGAGSAAYRYFQYEPIRWRVLRTYDDKVLILADRVLDAGTSALERFVDTAFSQEEQALILCNAFLLSDSDVYGTELAEQYGFGRSAALKDEARLCLSSTYARAKGVLSGGEGAACNVCAWWLGTQGRYFGYMMAVQEDGNVDTNGSPVSIGKGMRPAMYVKQDDTGVYRHAGRIDSTDMESDRSQELDDVRKAGDEGNTEESTNQGEESESGAGTETQTEEEKPNPEEATGTDEKDKSDEENADTGNTEPGDDTGTEEGAKPETDAGKAGDTKPEDSTGTGVDAKPETDAGKAEDTKPEDSTGTGVDAKPETDAGKAEDTKPEDSTGTGVDAKPETDAGKAEDTKPEDGTGTGVDAKPEAGSGETEVTKPEAGTGEAEDTKPEAGTGTEVDGKPETDTGATEGAEPGDESGTDTEIGEMTETDVRSDDGIVSGGDGDTKLGSGSGVESTQIVLPGIASYGMEKAVLTEIPDQIYNGRSVTPIVEVSYNDEVLKLNRDYRILYHDNINAGKASVTIVGIGSYNGSRTLPFTIRPFDVSGLSKELKGKDGTIYKTPYTKKAVRLMTAFRIPVTVNGETIYLEPKQGTDYTYKYKNNVKIGTAGIVYTFSGNYTGTLTKNFQIVPQAPKILRVKGENNALMVQWTKVSACDRYEIYRAASVKGKYKKIATVKGKNTCLYRDKKAKKGKRYYYKVRACKKVKGELYRSADSKIRKGAR